MAQDHEFETEGFSLGMPALVCRWRLANRKLPLENRHLRALGHRYVKGKMLSRELVAWAKQHIEWNLKDGTARYPDGVLMLIVDEEGKAAMTAGPYEPLEQDTLEALVRRATQASEEAATSSVPPESLWLVKRDCLLWCLERDHDPSGANTLVDDLARTLGLRVERRPGLLASLGDETFEGAFLVSDEHGVVVASDASCSVAQKFCASYQKLLA